MKRTARGGPRPSRVIRESQLPWRCLRGHAMASFLGGRPHAAGYDDDGWAMALGMLPNHLEGFLFEIYVPDIDLITGRKMPYSEDEPARQLVEKRLLDLGYTARQVAVGREKNPQASGPGHYRKPPIFSSP